MELESTPVVRFAMRAYRKSIGDFKSGLNKTSRNRHCPTRGKLAK